MHTNALMEGSRSCTNMINHDTQLLVCVRPSSLIREVITPSMLSRCECKRSSLPDLSFLVHKCQPNRRNFSCSLPATYQAFNCETGLLHTRYPSPCPSGILTWSLWSQTAPPPPTAVLYGTPYLATPDPPMTRGKRAATGKEDSNEKDSIPTHQEPAGGQQWPRQSAPSLLSQYRQCPGGYG
jgi:hypothetical protein